MGLFLNIIITEILVKFSCLVSNYFAFYSLLIYQLLRTYLLNIYHGLDIVAYTEDFLFLHS
jgi:hypothetical protein